MNGTAYRGSILLLADRTLPWAATAIGEVTAASLAPVAAAEPPVEVLLIGCGASAAPLPKALRADLKAKGIVAEAMDTGAACRTFNLLMAEGRRAAAALIAVE